MPVPHPWVEMGVKTSALTSGRPVFKYHLRYFPAARTWGQLHQHVLSYKVETVTPTKQGFERIKGDHVSARFKT